MQIDESKANHKFRNLAIFNLMIRKKEFKEQVYNQGVEGLGFKNQKHRD